MFCFEAGDLRDEVCVSAQLFHLAGIVQFLLPDTLLQSFVVAVLQSLL